MCARWTLYIFLCARSVYNSSLTSGQRLAPAASHLVGHLLTQINYSLWMKFLRSRSIAQTPRVSVLGFKEGSGNQTSLYINKIPAQGIVLSLRINGSEGVVQRKRGGLRQAVNIKHRGWKHGRWTASAARGQPTQGTPHKMPRSFFSMKILHINTLIHQ